MIDGAGICPKTIPCRPPWGLPGILPKDITEKKHNPNTFKCVSVHDKTKKNLFSFKQTKIAKGFASKTKKIRRNKVSQNFVVRAHNIG